MAGDLRRARTAGQSVASADIADRGPLSLGGLVGSTTNTVSGSATGGSGGDSGDGGNATSHTTARWGTPVTWQIRVHRWQLGLWGVRAGRVHHPRQLGRLR